MAKGHAGGKSGTVTYFQGEWHEDDPRLLRARDHGVWLSSIVFDGARAIAGKLPDIEPHCERVVNSARIMGLEPKITAEEIAALCREGVTKFEADAELYICPMFYGQDGFIIPDPESAEFLITIFEAPVPEPKGFSACKVSFRRPAPDMAPTEAKASCLYPNVARGMREANKKGFDCGIVFDPLGNVAEFSVNNLFFATNGVVTTPALNGTFLNGITRQRVLQLLRDDGAEVVERTVTFDEVMNADEVFATGNYAKVQPCTRIEDRQLQPGPFYRRARELYFGFVEAG